MNGSVPGPLPPHPTGVSGLLPALGILVTTTLLGGNVFLRLAEENRVEERYRQLGPAVSFYFA